MGSSVTFYKDSVSRDALISVHVKEIDGNIVESIMLKIKVKGKKNIVRLDLKDFF